MATAAELRALADRMEQEENAEAALRDAKEAFRANPDDADAQARHTEAAEALVALRKSRREEGISFAPNGPGDVVVVPGAVDETQEG